MMISWARSFLRHMRWSEIALGKLALGFIAMSVGVALDEISVRDVLGLFAMFAALGVFGYTWNDWWDRATDRSAGRSNAFDAVKAPVAALLFVASSAVALAISASLGRWILALTVAQLTICAIYSAPPLRLKGRGDLGMVAIVAAQYVLPAVILLVSARRPLLADYLYLGSVALADGLVLEIGHQRSQREGDAAAQVRTFAVSREPIQVREWYRLSVVVLGILFVICPLYLAIRLTVAGGSGTMWLVWMAPCVIAAVSLGLKTWSESRQERTGWDPYYGASGPATRQLFSYFPNCILPLYISIVATVRRPDAWPLTAIVIAMLVTLAISNTTLTTGPRHYGFRWHVNQVLDIFRW